MLIIREVFTAKPGQASKLAKLCKKAFGAEAKMTIMTDLVSDFNTVVIERQIESLAEFEREMQEYKSGKAPEMDPEVAKEMSKYTEMYLTGRREVYQVID